MSRIEDVSKETKMDRLKSAYQLSVSLQKLSKTYTNSFESDLNKFTDMMTSALDEAGRGTSSISVNDTNLNVNTTYDSFV